MPAVLCKNMTLKSYFEQTKIRKCEWMNSVYNFFKYLNKHWDGMLPVTAIDLHIFFQDITINNRNNNLLIFSEAIDISRLRTNHSTVKIKGLEGCKFIFQSKTQYKVFPQI